MDCECVQTHGSPLCLFVCMGRVGEREREREIKGEGKC